MQIPHVLTGEQRRNAEHVEEAAFCLRKHPSIDAGLEEITPEEVHRQMLPLRIKSRVEHVLRALH